MNQPSFVEGDYIATLEDTRVILKDDHFVLSSGLHSDQFVNIKGLYPYPEAVEFCAAGMVSVWQENVSIDDSIVDVVIGPAMGGVILAYEVAKQFDSSNHGMPLSLFAEKEADLQLSDGTITKSEQFALTRGYDKLLRGKRVLIVEDVLTSGKSVAKVVALVRAAGGIVVGVMALWNRNDVSALDLGGVPQAHSLITRKLPTYDQADCPQCKVGKPVNTEHGSFKKWVTIQGLVGAT